MCVICISYIVTSLSFRTSAFYSTVMSVSRTINITNPFYKLNLTLLKVSVVIYPLLLVPFLVLDIDQMYTYSPRTDHPLDLLDHTMSFYVYFAFLGRSIFTLASGNLVLLKTLVVTISLPFILPSLFTGVCVVYQCYTLLKPTKLQGGSAEKKRQITITIVMLTILFFVCNTPYIYCPIASTSGPGHTDFNSQNYVVSTVLPFFNAAFCPLILIIRGESIKVYIKRLLGMEINYTERNPSVVLTNISNAGTTEVQKQ